MFAIAFIEAARESRRAVQGARATDPTVAERPARRRSHHVTEPAARRVPQIRPAERALPCAERSAG